ncbi:MAG: hypothetical protein AAF726_04105 [Planctomycetota bacterium]
MRLVVLLALVLCAVGCRSTSISYRFTPSPLELLVQERPGSPIVARVLVGIPGAQRQGGRSNGLPEMLVSIRIENKSTETIRFDPSRSVLVGSDLAEFGEAKSNPAGVLNIPAGGDESVLVRYPFPQDGSLEAPLLTGVNLQFELDHGGQPVEVSVTLERNEPNVIYEPYPAFTFGAGYYYGW